AAPDERSGRRIASPRGVRQGESALPFGHADRARPAARADGTAVRSDAALRRGARGEPGRPGAARRAGAALRLDLESGIEPRRYRRSGAIAQRRVEALSQESLAPLLASAVAPREGRDAPLRSRARSPRLRASGQSGVLERARLSADG